MRQWTLLDITLADTVVIPADRRLPEKEEIWTLPNDQQETSTASLDDIIDDKSKVPHELDKVSYKTQESIPLDITDNTDINLPRSQETRKSKTKRVKSYLRKCKGALSKGDESVNEKKRQENCTSWYFDDNQSSLTRREENDDYFEKYTELSEDRLNQQQNDPEEATSNEITVDVLAKTSEEESNVNPECENRISVSENNGIDVSIKQCESDERQTCSKEYEEVIDTVTIINLSKENTNLDKCNSSDTLIAEVSECVNELNIDSSVQRNDEKINFEEKEEEEEEEEEEASNDPEIPLILPLPAIVIPIGVDVDILDIGINVHEGENILEVCVTRNYGNPKRLGSCRIGSGCDPDGWRLCFPSTNAQHNTTQHNTQGVQELVGACETAPGDSDD
ncbi:hypothetical protein M0804_008236 [Polistes exclamans]|nr:hypothetical protein M0804_008236 [Polistes exclamans]